LQDPALGLISDLCISALEKLKPVLPNQDLSKVQVGTEQLGQAYLDQKYVRYNFGVKSQLSFRTSNSIYQSWRDKQF
jgi:hypothetical protein